MNRISRVTVQAFDQPAGQHESPTGPKALPNQWHCLVLVQSDSGHQGEALVADVDPWRLKAIVAEVGHVSQSHLVGRRGCDHAWLWTQLHKLVYHGELSVPGWAAIDMALWDLAGKEAGLLLCEILGAVRATLPVYVASSEHETLQQCISEAQQCKQRGITGYKPHASGAPVREVVELAATLRRELGDEYTLMLDGNLSYSLEDALRIGRVLEKQRFDWFEDPMSWGYSGELDRLASRLEIPIASTDFPVGTLNDVTERLAQGSTVRIVRAGGDRFGITGLMRVGALAEAFGKRLDLHVATSAHASAAHMHVALASPACQWHEMLDPASWYQWGAQAPIEPSPSGEVTVSARPGLGVELDWDLLAQHRLS